MTSVHPLDALQERVQQDLDAVVFAELWGSLAPDHNS